MLALHLSIPVNKRKPQGHLLRIVAALSTLFLACGCLQLETRIKLNPDGSATVTERFRILRSLRELEKGAGIDEGLTFEGLLGRERVLERMKQMGKGVSLVSHEVRDAEAGSREAISVFRVESLTDLTYASPFLMLGERVGKMRINIHPMYGDNWSQVAGILFLQFRHIEKKQAEKKTEALALLTRIRESPLARQEYRDVAPIFRDLLKGFKVRIVFENYGEILGNGGHAVHLFRYARPKEMNIIDYSYGGETGGRTGTHVLDNEENVVDLVKLLLQNPGENARGTRKGAFLGRHTGRDYANAVIRPSPHYFDRYFKGKTLSFTHRWRKKKGERPADYAEIGEPGL